MAHYANIDSERVRLKLSRSDIARCLNISKNSLSNKLNKHTPFTGIELLVLSKLTEKSIEYLLEPDSINSGNAIAHIAEREVRKQKA